MLSVAESHGDPPDDGDAEGSPAVLDAAPAPRPAPATGRDAVDGGDAGSGGASSRTRAKPVFLRDFVDVGRPLADVRRRFCGSGDWLAPLARQAAGDADTLLVRFGAGVGSLGLDARVRLGDPSVQGAGVAVPIRWESARLPHLFPVLDGDVELAPLGPDHCRLVLRCSYRPPFDRVGRVLDSFLLHRVAESTIRAFLTRVAESLEAEGVADGDR
ncbi:MAG: SRPBCC family protein [Acidimicrobiales bacterium]